MKQYCIYILASGRNGTLYIGVARDLPKRVYKHKQDMVDGFTKKYNVHDLDYEAHEKGAITREKEKKWNRAWKMRLIEEMNPEWDDLYNQIF